MFLALSQRDQHRFQGGLWDHTQHVTQFTGQRHTGDTAVTQRTKSWEGRQAHVTHWAGVEGHGSAQRGHRGEKHVVDRGGLQAGACKGPEARACQCQAQDGRSQGEGGGREEQADVVPYGQPPSLTARGGDASFSEQDGKPRVHPIHFKRKCTPWLLQGDQIVAKTTQMQATPQSCSET